MGGWLMARVSQRGCVLHDDCLHDLDCAQRTPAACESHAMVEETRSFLDSRLAQAVA